MPHKVFIFVPAFGQQISATTFLTSHAIHQHLAHHGIQAGVSTMSFPDIAELRAMAMTIWYDTMPDSDYLLFIDADMGFPPQMITDMILFNEPIVGTIYPQRKMPLSWAGSGTGDPVTERRGKFMRVEGVGMGCTMIKREVVTRMLEAMPELVDTRLKLHPAGDTIRSAGSNRLIRAWEKLDVPDRGLVSEDISFCIRWNRIVGKNDVWAGIDYMISHVGPFDYCGRYLDSVEKAEAAKLAQTEAPSIAPSAGGTTLAESMQVVTQAVESVPEEMKVAAE